MTDQQHENTPETTSVRFHSGLDDAVIVPLVVVALVAKKLFRTLLSALV
jgi:hypothetical protein